jgi:hypothetical protein
VYLILVGAMNAKRHAAKHTGRLHVVLCSDRLAFGSSARKYHARESAPIFVKDFTADAMEIVSIANNGDAGRRC